MHYKTVNDHQAKGIILTAESLLDLKEGIEKNFEGREKDGALAVYEFLLESYKKIK